MTQLSYVCTNIIVCIIYISFYGYLRALISIYLGDRGEVAKNRLTLNPRVHIDPVGFFFMIIYGVGFIKPMLNQSINFKNRKGATILIATLPTLILFTLSTMVMWVYFYVVDIMQMPNGLVVVVYQGQILPTFCTIFIIQSIRVSLGTLIYNILPIYPLEGEKIFNYFATPNLRFLWSSHDKVLQMALVVFTVFGFLPKGINLICDYYISIFY